VTAPQISLLLKGQSLLPPVLRGYNSRVDTALFTLTVLSGSQMK